MSFGITLNESFLADKNKALKSNELNRNSLSFRLNHAMQQLGISQSDLAKQINVKPQVIQYLCSKSILNSKFSYEIAEALGVNYSWLTVGEGPMLANNVAKIENHEIKLLALNDLDLYLNKNIDQIKSNSLFVNIYNTDGCFALQVTDSSMEPRIDFGTIAVFDQNISVSDNDFVLAKIAKSGVWLIRQFSIKDNVKYLLPMNTHIYNVIKLEEQDLIFAVMVQTIQNFKEEG